MNVLIIILIILTALVLISHLVMVILYLELYPFTRDGKFPKQAFFRLNSRFYHEKTKSHDFQVLSGWHDGLTKAWQKDLQKVKDPAKLLEKAITEYQNDPDIKKAKGLIFLSNHISNRIRYDEKIDGLIEKISEMTKSEKF
ncbi:MAG: hypothetical protein KFF73_20185 [Cyclobacteriaceae bacterium]|nr:hypothetical protein [Cyclobacteriaceae bacterium]